jgi:tetratricopeptide (TPR) repeat protein
MSEHKLQLSEIHKYLIEHQYIHQHNGQWLLGVNYSADLLKEAKVEYDTTITRINEILAVESYKKVQDWELLFMEFIRQAEVPRMMEDTRGNLYYTNKFSSDALKVFRKAIEKDGVQLPVLLASVKLYYKSKVRLKKAIGNYFTQGDWKSGYEDLKASADKGDIAIHEHIKQHTDESGNSGWKLG